MRGTPGTAVRALNAAADRTGPGARVAFADHFDVVDVIQAHRDGGVFRMWGPPRTVALAYRRSRTTGGPRGDVVVRFGELPAAGSDVGQRRWVTLACGAVAWLPRCVHMVGAS